MQGLGPRPPFASRGMITHRLGCSAPKSGLDTTTSAFRLSTLHRTASLSTPNAERNLLTVPPKPGPTSFAESRPRCLMLVHGRYAFDVSENPADI